MQGLTLFKNIGPAQHEAPQEEAESSAMYQPEGQPHLWLAALLVLTAALWIMNRNISFGPFSIALGVIATVAVIVLLKTFFGRIHVPGLSQVILAV